MKFLFLSLFLLLTPLTYGKLSKSEHKKLKKECEEKGYVYSKSGQACSATKKTRAHKKCLKFSGKWVFDSELVKGSCEGAITAKERACTKKGGTYNRETKKCSGKKNSNSSARKMQKKCRKDGYEYNPETNSCSEILTVDRKECETKEEGIFSNGKCKVSKDSVDAIKNACNELGWKYDRKKNTCSTNKKTKDRKSCDKRFKIVDGQRQRATFEKGVCSISNDEMNKNIVAIKKECKEKGLKYDRLTFGCHEWKKTKKGKKAEKKGLETTAIEGNDGEQLLDQTDGKKNSRKLSKQAKSNCKKLGFKYDKFQAKCDESKKTSARASCEERGGEFNNGNCIGGLSKKEFTKQQKEKAKEKKINDKKFRKELMEEAKITFNECKASSTTRDRKQQCRLDFRTEKRLINAKYGSSLFRSKEFQTCLDKALAEENNEMPEGIDAKQVSRALVTKCYKERNRNLIKNGILGLAATGSFFLLPGGGAVALGMIVGKIAMSKIDKALNEIENNVVEHVKSYALQEGRRLTQKTIDEVILDVRKAYYQQLGIEPTEDHLNGVIKSDKRLTKKEDKRLKKIENRAAKHWRETSLRQAKENYKLCIRSGNVSRDSCKFVLKKNQAAIKEKVRNKFFTSSFLNECLDKAGDDDLKKALCFKDRKDQALKTGILLVLTGGALMLSPGKMQEYLHGRIKRVGKKITDETLKQIEKETLDIIVKDSIEGFEVASQPVIEEGLAIFKDELNATCIKLKLDCTNLKIDQMGDKDRDSLLKEMKKTAKAQADEKYQACVNSSSFTAKQCRLLKRMDERFIKTKYNSGILRSKSFNSCLDKADEKYKLEDKLGSIDHKLEINQCFKQRNAKRVKYAIITLAAAGAITAAYALDFGQISTMTTDFISSQLKSQLKSQGAQFEEGEGLDDKSMGEYAQEIAGKKLEVYYKKGSKYVTGASTPVEMLTKFEVGVIATVKAIEHKNGIPVYNKTLEEVIDAARKEYFEQIGKIDGELLTRSEKKQLNTHLKDTVEKLKNNEIEEISKAYDLCVADLSMRKSKCKELRKVDLRMVKAKYNSRFLNSKTFRDCLDKAFNFDDLTKRKVEVNRCFIDRNKRNITKAIIVATIVTAAAITWSIKDDGVSDWIETYVIDKGEKMYGEELKEYVEKKHIELLTRYYTEATEAGMTPIEKTRLVKNLNQVWENEININGRIGQFYINQERTYRENFNNLNNSNN